MKIFRVLGIIGIGCIVLGCITPYMYVSALGLNKSNYFLLTVDKWKILLLIPSVINVIKPKAIGKAITIGTSATGFLLYFFGFIQSVTHKYFSYDPEIGSLLLIAGFGLMVASTFDFSPRNINYTNVEDEPTETSGNAIKQVTSIVKPEKTFAITLPMIEGKILNIWAPPECELTCYENNFRIYANKDGVNINLQYFFKDVTSIDVLPLNKSAANVSFTDSKVIQIVFKTSGDLKVFNNIVTGAEETSDVSSQIEKLHELKEKGILTDEEFQSKKKDLLDKMW